MTRMSRKELTRAVALEREISQDLGQQLSHMATLAGEKSQQVLGAMAEVERLETELSFAKDYAAENRRTEALRMALAHHDNRLVLGRAAEYLSFLSGEQSEVDKLKAENRDLHNEIAEKAARLAQQTETYVEVGGQKFTEAQWAAAKKAILLDDEDLV